MADYRAIKGLNIQSVSSDNATIQLGDIWYNSTLGKLRGAKIAAGSWASAPALGTARYGAGGCGSQTATLNPPAAVANVPAKGAFAPL